MVPPSRTTSNRHPGAASNVVDGPIKRTHGSSLDQKALVTLELEEENSANQALWRNFWSYSNLAAYWPLNTVGKNAQSHRLSKEKEDGRLHEERPSHNRPRKSRVLQREWEKQDCGLPS